MWRCCREHVGWAIAIGYLLFLIFWIRFPDLGGWTAAIGRWGQPDSRSLTTWMERLALGLCGDALGFATLGFLGMTVPARGRTGSGRVSARLWVLMGIGAIVALACAVEVAAAGHLVGCGDLMVPLVGCLLGIWAGATWRRGWRARLWFIPEIALATLVAALGTGLLMWSSLEETPLPFEGARMTSAERQRLEDLALRLNPGPPEEGRIHSVCLTEPDLNALLCRHLPRGTGGCQARFCLDRGGVVFLMSAVVPGTGARRRYLNLQMSGGAAIADGIVSLRGDRCRIGHREIPRWLLRAFCTLAASRLNRDPHLRPFLGAVREVVIEPNSVQLAWEPLHLWSGSSERLGGRAAVDEELLVSTRVQVDRLLTLFAVSPQFNSQPSFNLCLASAFALARRRSVDGDPLVENRAAILALGVLLGHSRIETFLGPVLTDRDRDAVQQTVNRVTLRGRFDWTRHFCVCAALCVLSQEAVSDAVALLKEELDAEEGGSGFSFGDLLADRAGAAFASRATCSTAAARAMQDRLADGFDVGEVFPPADDLPEEIADAELKDRYRGVGGAGYGLLMAEIERRIAACAAYR